MNRRGGAGVSKVLPRLFPVRALCLAMMFLSFSHKIIYYTTKINVTYQAVSMSFFARPCRIADTKM